MKYSIFYIIKGEAGKYNQKLIKKVGPMFGENYMVEHYLPAHITLKSPFEIDNIQKVERVLKKFVKEQNPAKIKINGFGNFRKFVSFMKTEFSISAFKIQRDLIKELKKIGINPHEFDIKFKPHMTIAYGNTKKSFNGIWNYLGKLDKPEFNLMLNNLAIMKKGKTQWNVHKEFKIK